MTLTNTAPAASPGTMSPAGARGLALRDAFTVAPGMVPFGAVLGVTVAVVGADRVAGLVGAVAVYGGSAQLSAVTLLDKGIPVVAAVLTAAVVNLRLLLYSAALGGRFRRQPRPFRWLAPHFMIDQTYLMAAAREDLDDHAFRRYWVARRLCPRRVDLRDYRRHPGRSSTADLPHLALVGTTLFIGMLVPRLVSRPAVVAAAVGGLAALTVSQVAPALGIIAGATSGVLAAQVLGGRDV